MPWKTYWDNDGEILDMLTKVRDYRAVKKYDVIFEK